MESNWQSPWSTNRQQQSPTWQRQSQGQSSGGGNGGNALAGAGVAMAIGGMFVQAIGGYYAAKSAKLQARSQALALEFEGTMADLNAKAAELDAQAILRAGRYDAARMSMAAGAEIAAGRVQQAAGGLQAGVGSAAEVAASANLIKRMDAWTINMNSVRAANQARARATDMQNRGLLSRTAAANARRMGRAISTTATVATGLLSGAGGVGGSLGSYYGRS